MIFPEFVSLPNQKDASALLINAAELLIVNVVALHRVTSPAFVNVPANVVFEFLSPLQVNVPLLVNVPYNSASPV